MKCVASIFGAAFAFLFSAEVLSAQVIVYAMQSTRARKWGKQGSRPSVTFKEGLERTVHWYLDNEDWWCYLQDWDGDSARLSIKA